MSAYKRCDKCKRSTEEVPGLDVSSVRIEIPRWFVEIVDLCGTCRTLVKKYLRAKP